jgi:DNA-binding SARP family transcriptional activator/predicted ATPase
MPVRESARLHLIGSPFVSVDGNRLALPTRKLLALMAILALDGPTERAQLAQLLWPDLDADARGSLRRELYRLRKMTNAKLLLEQGQVLSLDEVSTDWHDFQTALETQNWAVATTLTRGSLLEGFNVDSIEFEEWIELHRTKFEDQQRHALLQHALQLESQDAQHEALEVFERLLHVDALNENAVRGMMRTLENLGDTTRLLAVYKQFSDRLEFELGIQPSNETRSMAAKAKGERLTEQPSHAITNKANTPTARSSHTPLVGRKLAWAQLEEAWETGKTILISGEPGMGKSSLMLEFADHKSQSNQRVTMLNRPGDAQTPFSSLTRMLRSMLQDHTPDLPNWVATELARLLPELGEPNSNTDAEQGKSRLLAATAEFIQRATTDLQLLIHDDIQFMDHASWELQNNLTLNSNQTVRNIMAYRKNELPASIQADIHAMIAADQAILIELQGLEQTAVQELVQSNFKATPEQTQTLSQRLHTFTGGNPLFVLETLKAIQETGQIETTIQSTIQTNTQLPNARRVRDIINSRLERLNKTARDLVRITAIAPESYSLEMVATVLGGDAMHFHDASFELEQAGIMHDGRFSHDALYETALESIPKPARVLLHNRVLSFLISQPRLRGTASVYLRHAEGAQNPTQILEWSVMAAKEATERFAYSEALAHYDRALQIETDPRKSFELLWEQSRIHRIQGHREVWGKTVEGMLWQAAQTRDSELETRAALAELELLLEHGEYRDAIQYTERLLERPGLSPRNRGMALVYAAHTLTHLERLGEAEQRLLEAEPLIPPEEYALVGRMQAGLRNAANKRNDLHEAQRRNELTLEAYRRAGNRSGEIAARLGAGLLSEKMNDVEAARLNYQVAVERAQELGDAPMQRNAIFSMSNFLMKQLDVKAAGPWVAKGLQISLEPPDIRFEGIFREQQAYLHCFNGELGLMIKSGEQALHCYQQLGFSAYAAEQHEWLAHRLIELGQYEAALKHIKQGEHLAQRDQLEEYNAYFMLARARYEFVAGQIENAIALLSPMLLSPDKYASSRSFPTRVLLGQTYFVQGQIEQAVKLLSIQEKLPTDEVFRLTALLNIQIAQNDVQQVSIEAAERLVERQVPRSHAFELKSALASAFRSKKLYEKANKVMTETLKSQEFLAASLQPEQRASFLKHSGNIIAGITYSDSVFNTSAS